MTERPNLELSWTLEFLDPITDGLQPKYWAGSGNLTITETDGSVSTYTGMNGVVKLQPPRERSGDGVKITAEMDATDLNVRNQLRRDIGPLQIRVRWIWYDDANSVWKLTGKEFIGRLSEPILQGKSYTINVESLITDIDRGRVVNWSHDTQKARYPNDEGFAFLKSLAEGLELKWPPT